jgi:hypothetical protein
MYPPTPTDDPTRQPTRPPTWDGLVAAVLALAGVPLALWTVSNPLAGVALFVCLGGVVVAGRSARRLVAADPGGETGDSEPSAPALGARPAAPSSRGRR